MAMGAPGMLGTVRAVLYADSAHFRYGCRQASEELRLLAQETRLHTQSLVATGAALGAAIALPLGRFTKQAAMAFGGFELGMTKVGNVAKLTGMEIEDMTKKVLDLSKAYNIDPTDIARGAYSLAQAAIVDPKLLGAATEQAARLTKASGFEISTDQAATAIGQLMQAFSVPLNEVGALTDMIVRTQELSIAKWGEMISNMGKASGVFSTVFDDNKQGLLEMMTLMAVVTQGGEKMTRASTGVRNIIERIIKEGKKSDSPFFLMANEKGYGDAVEMLKAQGVVKMLQEIAEYSGFAADEMMAAGFQKRELTAALLALRNQGVNMKGVQDKLANSAGTADFAISRLSKTQKELFDSFSTTKARFMIDFGESFKSIWASIVPVLNSVMEGFMALPSSVKRLVALTAIITALSSALLLLRGALMSIRLLGQTGAFGGVFGAAGKSGSLWKGMLLGMTGGMAGAGGASFGNLQGIFSSKDATIAKDLKESVIALRSAKALDPAAARAVQAKFWKSYGAVLASTPIRDAVTKKTTSDFVTGRGSPTSIFIPGVGRLLRKDAADGMSQADISHNVSQGVHERNMEVSTKQAVLGTHVLRTLWEKLSKFFQLLLQGAAWTIVVITAWEALKMPFEELKNWLYSLGEAFGLQSEGLKKFFEGAVKVENITMMLRAIVGEILQTGNFIGYIVTVVLSGIKTVFEYLYNRVQWLFAMVTFNFDKAKEKELANTAIDEFASVFMDITGKFVDRGREIDEWASKATPQKTAKTPEEIAAEQKAKEDERNARNASVFDTIADLWKEKLAELDALTLEMADLLKVRNEDKQDVNKRWSEESQKLWEAPNQGWASAALTNSVEAWNSSFGDNSYLDLQRENNELSRERRDALERIEEEYKEASRKQQAALDGINTTLAALELTIYGDGAVPKPAQ